MLTVCTQAGEWIWSLMCVSLSLDDIMVQFPPEGLSAALQSHVSVFVTIILLWLRHLNVCFGSTICETAKKNIKVMFGKRNVSKLAACQVVILE